MASAPPVLLLAGWGQSSCFWDRFRPHLSRTGAVIAPDNRETGSKGPCPEGFTVEDMAADALAAVDSAAVDRFCVVGHSMGGMIAQALAFLVPDRIERLVLVSTTPGQARSVPLDASALTLPEGLKLPEDPEQAAIAIRAAFLERFMARPGDPPVSLIAREEAERAQGNSAELDGMIRQLQAIHGWNPPGELKGLGLDVTVMHGDADRLVPYANGLIVAERAGVPLVTLEGVGHMVPWETPEELAAVIRDGWGGG